MLQSVSPYALLQASKPKPVPTLVTPYDLYSAAQTEHSAVHQYDVSTAESLTGTDQTSNQSTQKSISPRRTHYIADIHARHNQALSGSVRRSIY